MFSGSIPALVTPFAADGSFVEGAFRDLVEWQITEGSTGLVPVGTTGEAATLTFQEHFDVVRVCVDQAKGRVPILAGAGSNDTRVAIGNVHAAKEAGADAALMVPPYYNRPSQEGLYAHYAAINEAVQLPVLVYNVPGRTSVDISDATLARLSVLPNIVGIKDATGDMARATLQRITCGDGWVMLTGDDPTALGYMAHGGHGCISVTANVAPDLVSAFYNAALGGDWKAALYWQDRLLRLHKGLFADASPGPTKFAMAQLGLCLEDARLPITPCSEAAREIVLAAMREAGVIN